MNADIRLEDIRIPVYPEEDEIKTIVEILEAEIMRRFCKRGNPDDDDYMTEVMYGGQIDWDAEEW
jgi:hypothetical protein